MICVSLGRMSYEECREIVLRERFVELRMDLLKLTQSQLQEIIALPGKKILTCRKGDYTDNERLELFLESIGNGVDYIDLELEMLQDMKHKIISKARSCSSQVIVSHHDYSGTPGKETLLDLIQACKKAGADIVKLACQVMEPADNIRLLALYEANQQLVIIGMGKLGTITRIAGPLLGGLFTYAAPGQEMETAAGQLTRESLQLVYGLIGADIDEPGE
jgi:3-dehydroquinate dehydratase-1